VEPLLIVIGTALNFISQVPQFGFLFFFLSAWHAGRGRFGPMVVNGLIAHFLFFSPNFAVLVDRMLKAGGVVH